MLGHHVEPRSRGRRRAVAVRGDDTDATARGCRGDDRARRVFAGSVVATTATPVEERAGRTRSPTWTGCSGHPEAVPDAAAARTCRLGHGRASHRRPTPPSPVRGASATRPTLTPDRDTGIGGWTEEVIFVESMRTGRHRGTGTDPAADAVAHVARGSPTTICARCTATSPASADREPVPDAPFAAPAESDALTTPPHPPQQLDGRAAQRTCSEIGAFDHRHGARLYPAASRGRRGPCPASSPRFHPLHVKHPVVRWFVRRLCALVLRRMRRTGRRRACRRRAARGDDAKVASSSSSTPSPWRRTAAASPDRRDQPARDRRCAPRGVVHRGARTANTSRGASAISSAISRRRCRARVLQRFRASSSGARRCVPLGGRGAVRALPGVRAVYVTSDAGSRSETAWR